jgi:hypothetical protein
MRESKKQLFSSISPQVQFHLLNSYSFYRIYNKSSFFYQSKFILLSQGDG